jgi:hypothetical protein
MSVVNVIIPGAPKAGTMAITSILNQHRDIYVPAWKEPRFFIEDKIRELADKAPLKKYLMKSSTLDWQKYKSIYENKCRFKIDASVQYLYYFDSVVPKIKKYLGDPFIFIILRDPVQRALSNYYFNRRIELKISSSFIDSIKKELNGDRDELFGFLHHYKVGLYYEQVKYFLENFSKVKVLFYEDFQSDNLGFVNSILETLSLSKLETIQELPKLNTSSEFTLTGKLLFSKYSPYRLTDKFILPLFINKDLLHKRKLELKAKLKKKTFNPKLTEEEMKFMYDLYEEDVTKLMRLLNLSSLPWPKFKHNCLSIC